MDLNSSIKSAYKEKILWDTMRYLNYSKKDCLYAIKVMRKLRSEYKLNEYDQLQLFTILNQVLNKGYMSKEDLVCHLQGILPPITRLLVSFMKEDFRTLLSNLGSKRLDNKDMFLKLIKCIDLWLEGGLR